MMFLEAVGLIAAATWVIRRSNRNPSQRLRSASNLVHGPQMIVSECQAAVKSRRRLCWSRSKHC